MMRMKINDGHDILSLNLFLLHDVQNMVVNIVDWINADESTLNEMKLMPASTYSDCLN